VRWILWAVVSAVILLMAGWSDIINLVLPYETRPESITFKIDQVSDAQFDSCAKELTRKYGMELIHIDIFRKEGIRSYDGPRTCQRCHVEIKVAVDEKATEKVNLRSDLTQSVHFTFAPKSGFATYGFNGEKVEGFPLGKMDRACGVTGTFTWTGWATLIPTAHGDTISEGCGQCHIVGQYGPISGAMMPGYRATDAEWEATDCLICHAAEYDMNYRQVVQDSNGKYRWEHDRRFISAMSVGLPKSENCLHCHQHNLGGDTYPGNVDNLVNVGRERPRLAHAGAKRGTPFSAEWDVHAAAGMSCLDCHIPQGHKIPRGTMSTDLVANDLPDVEVSCLNCHGESPHTIGQNAGIYNDHIASIACETCHIHRLYPDNLVFRDWANPVFNEEHGIYTPRNAPFEAEPGKAIVYRWFNGNGTFMANALGDNPNGKQLYRSLSTTPNTDWAGLANFDYNENYEKIFRPIATKGKSKIYPFKRFQAVMYEDLNNQGPYGGMILPINYNVYYSTGDAKAAVKVASESKIMRMMYGAMFKYYMMDRYMAYMAIDGWDTNFSMDRIAARAMRNEGQLMINHAIQRVGRACNECHVADGLLDFVSLGYSPEEVASLQKAR
jgi:hypothetical protein